MPKYKKVVSCNVRNDKQRHDFWENRKDMIGSALKSLSDQNFTDFEVIVINDGGEDVAHILRDVGNLSYKYVNLPENKGLCNALNEGLRIADGEFITCLDDDDVMLKYALNHMRNGFINDSIMAVYGNIKRYFPDGGFQEKFPGQDILKTQEQMLDQNWACSCAKMYRKTALIQTGGWNTKYDLAGDWESAIRVACHYGIEAWNYIDAIVAEVYVHSNSMSHVNEEKMIKEKREVVDYHSRLMNNGKVAIIIPVYNASEFLIESLDSIANQTYKNVSVLITDDCSTDDSFSMIENYIKKGRHNNFTLFRNNKNMGVPKTLNFMLKRTGNADYIARHDADDVSVKDRIEKQVMFLDENEDIDMVGSFYVHIDQIHGKKEYFYEKPVTDAEIRRNHYLINSFVHGSVMIRKCVLEKVGYYDENCFLWEPEDYDYWTRIMQKCKVANIPEHLYKWRCYPDNRCGMAGNDIGT